MASRAGVLTGESQLLASLTDGGLVMKTGILMSLSGGITGAQSRRKTSAELLSNDPWLEDFERRIGGFEKSYEKFRKEPTLMSTALLGYVVQVYHEVFDVIWRLVLEENAKNAKDSPSLDEGPFDYDEFEKIQNHRQWKTIGLRVKQFTELANCPISPEADRNVFSYVNTIYHRSFQTASNEQEAKLLAEIAHLKEENRKQSQKLREQDRILSCLAFRYILERLPDHRTKNEANNWTEFWEKALKEANKPDGMVTPVTQIIKSHGRYEQGPDQPANVTQIKSVGSALYNTLSTNIHHFTGDYTLGRDQWDVLPRKILEAIVPKNINDGTVEWETERYRFIPRPSDLAPATPSALVPDSGSGSATSSATASAGSVPPTSTA